MRGYPKTLNTKDDYLYVKEHFAEELWRPDWEALLTTMKDYFFVRYLDDEEEAPTGEGIKIVEPSREGERRSVYELQISPTCKLYQLGFTEEEVRSFLGL